MVDNLETISCQIIVHSGNAKAEAYEALRAAKEKRFGDAEILLDNAEKENVKSHKIHMKLLGEEFEFKNSCEQLLVTHAMDTLMTTVSEINLIKEIIDMYKEIIDMYKEKER